MTAPDSDFAEGPMTIDCLHSLGVNGVCAHCGRDILAEAAEATAAKLDPPSELDALAIIVNGFELLPEEARGRTYQYLMSRYPQKKVTR